MGLGDFSGIQLIGEKRGLIPSSQWKLKARKQAWLLGETISASIGQGYNLVTPIQQLNMVATVANGGALLRPYLVKEIQDPNGRVLKKFFPQVLKTVDVNEQHLNLVKEALRGVVNEQGGTGGRARIKDIQVSGKTGTAQVVHMKVTEEIEDEDQIPYQFRDHAWFVAFAPYEKPDIAVVVLVEHGGHGGAAAAPVAKKIMQTYFEFYPPPADTVEKASLPEKTQPQRTTEHAPVE